MQEMAQAEPLGKGQGPPGGVDDAVANETADNRRGAFREIREDAGVERHQGEAAAISGEAGDHRRDELAVVMGGAFELDYQQDAAGHLLQELGKGKDAVMAAGERDAGQGDGRAGRDGTGFAGQAVEALVMEDHRAAVGGKPDVAFDGIAMSDRCSKCRSAVLDPAALICSRKF